MRGILLTDVVLDFIFKGELVLSICNPTHIPRQNELVHIGMESHRVLGVHWEIKESVQTITVTLIDDP